MNTALWVVQIVLAVLYVMAGLWGGFSGIRPGAPGGRAQLGGSRGLGWRNPGGRGGCVCGLPPLARDLYGRRSHVGLGPPGRFCGLGNVQMKEVSRLKESAYAGIG